MKLMTLSESQTMMTFISLALLLLFSYVFGTLAEKIKGPRVVGEILGGMILGGSCLFILLPEAMKKIFFAYPEQGQVLNIFYQLGLIFLMFLSGYNTEIKLCKKNARTISLVFIGATVIPMLAAIPFISLFRKSFIGVSGNNISFSLVFCIGVAITSIPVISKIFFDMGIMNTKFSNTVLTVATFQDLCLWILLNIATKVAAAGKIDILHILMIVLSTLGAFALITAVSRMVRSSIKVRDSKLLYTVCFVMLLAVCGLFSVMGINIMYSAFIVGYTVKVFFGKEAETVRDIYALKDIVFSFFVPVYFALVGIQLNVINDFSPARFLLFFIIAFGLEFIGTWAALIFSDLSGNMKMNFAVTMNARGGPGIVLATVGYGAGIISLEFFTVLILTTMLSSMTAGYYLRYQQKKDKAVFDSL
ncbi:MAG: cation:proton antiporter [Ruminococcus sp.]|uniref:cation:proton antiporter n=1 Tax=Ruminococcus sp. TaxID=41978 RepID=UPI001B2A25A1|nr:cation:proton antiporter [Ruminococcus sp.]MBO7473592.1 cation:proton antiporter [Ruminococcus sp.]